MTDCPHDIMHRVVAPSGLRYWACRCGARARLHSDSRNRALADFVAAFDAWDDSGQKGTEDIWGPLFKALLAARAALDATEDLPA